MKVSEIQCKTAMSRSGIYGWTYTINSYRGCMHQCRYCYAPNIIKIPRSTWGSFVEVKMNIPTVLAKELKRVKPALVGLSSVTDPYQELERKYKVTRYCLEQLLRYKFPISIITKSPLIIRDLDLIKRFTYSEIAITITTLDDKLSHLLESRAPSISERLSALKKLSSEGLNTYAFLGPLLPTLELGEVKVFIEKVLDTGVKAVMVDSLNLKPGIWQDIKNALEIDPETRTIFERHLFTEKDYYQRIFRIIQNECENKGVKFEF